ncbi:hypothetical protein ACXUPC_22445, partial [Pseudomonas marginalis]
GKPITRRNSWFAAEAEFFPAVFEPESSCVSSESVKACSVASSESRKSKTSDFFVDPNPSVVIGSFGGPLHH